MATATEHAYREGARWINQRPSPEDFALWFNENVPLHDEALKLDRYIGGIVLIPAEETVKVPELSATGNLLITERKQMVYIPYPKVETRINYFWDLMALRKDDWRPVINPVEVAGKYQGDGAIAQINRTLPPGFIVMPVPVFSNGAAGYSNFFVASFSVAVYDRDVDWSRGEDGVLRPHAPPIMEGRGTKMVALTKGFKDGSKTWADENSIMKVETGAIGRALGMLGMLAVPGAGVATAEDMIEALSAERAGATEAPQEPTLPPTPATPAAPAQQAAAPIEAAAPEQKTAEQEAAEERTALLARTRELVNTLGKDYPEKMEEFRQWATGRQPPIRDLSKLQGGALKGTIKRLEKLVQEGQDADSAEAKTVPFAGDASDIQGIGVKPAPRHAKPDRTAPDA